MRVPKLGALGLSRVHRKRFRVLGPLLLQQYRDFNGNPTTNYPNICKLESLDRALDLGFKSLWIKPLQLLRRTVLEFQKFHKIRNPDRYIYIYTLSSGFRV